jgi:hypothetical protein
LTLSAPPNAAQDALLDSMVTLASAGSVGLVVKGRQAGDLRGWYHAGTDTFQSDRRAETADRATLEALAAPGAELTFTVVPRLTERRIGVDRDRDGIFDRDELDAGTDPAHPDPRPRRFVPDPERP